MKQSPCSYHEQTTSSISVGVRRQSERFRSIFYSTNQLHGEHKVYMGGGGGGGVALLVLSQHRKINQGNVLGGNETCFWGEVFKSDSHLGSWSLEYLHELNWEVRADAVQTNRWAKVRNEKRQNFTEGKKPMRHFCKKKMKFGGIGITIYCKTLLNWYKPHFLE